MQPLYGRKLFPLCLGILMFVIFFTVSCQTAPSIKPSSTPNILSTVVSEQRTKVVQLVTSAPNEPNNDQRKGIITPNPTNDMPSLPDVAFANGIQISLESVDEVENGYVLKGRISKDPGVMLFTNFGVGTQLLDAHGGVIPTQRYLAVGGASLSDAYNGWGLQTIGKDFPGPWRLIIPSLMIELSGKVGFDVDLGPNPQYGQSWDVNIPIDFYGHTFIVQKVELVQDSVNSQPTLAFTFTGNPEIFRIESMEDPDNRIRHGSGHVTDADSGVMSLSFSYEQIPTGIHHLFIYSVIITKQGPWSLRWQPHNSSASGNFQATATEVQNQDELYFLLRTSSDRKYQWARLPANCMIGKQVEHIRCLRFLDCRYTLTL